MGENSQPIKPADRIEIDGRVFVSAADMPIAPWNCVISDRPVTTLTLKDDDLFLVSDTLGNISGVGCRAEGIEASMGLFCRDTRFLNRLELQIDGRSPILLSSSAHKGFSLSALCSNPQIDDQIAAETIGIQREIAINGGLFEEIQITNYNSVPVSFNVSLSFDADFVDLFEVRGFGREQRGKLLRYLPDQRQTSQLPKHIVLAYQGLDSKVLESRIQFHGCQPDQIVGNTAIWNLELSSHKSVTLEYYIHLFADQRLVSSVNAPTTLMQAKAAEFLEQQTWAGQITQIQTDNKFLNQAIARAEQDIYLLRQTFAGSKVLAAGVPWFSTLFGRDSIITASQTLILDPLIACETLGVLAKFQGQVEDDWREEEPGKILHEIRLGEMARCHEIPHTPYYGTVDATPLWLMLYAEYFAWTADHKTLERLWPNAIAAMDWIDRNCKQTGYLSYNRRSKRGLVNQGWKDSGNCIVNAQGELAQGAIALAEVQAYVYAAKLRMSELAKVRKLPDLAETWQAQARDLKTRFNQDFWLPSHDYCALALDGAGQPVDSITSNPGHCLNLGILDPEKALSVAERLQAPDMFNGWGIRTLSSLSPAYNPMGYHIGSVWPHDNGMITLGLRSLGLVEQSLEVASGLIDMTLAQPYQRPPELFCGYERDGDSLPVQYPVACSPQAWASGTVFQLIATMINLVPNAPGNQVHIIDPALIESIRTLSIQNLRIGSTLLDLEFERSGDTTAYRVSKKRGNLRVVIEA
ncbi:MAG: amylo-alpha-1,6-glucosidase [Aphanocapsa sp. GSE-SYN-MK-11-07L]|jgi:glycogen debranching enzyme|nr:amylo-alpha-1,6-glucosidase [Aphanocapsa sp. GSE-SYN-MK-11-07L]